MKKLLSLLSAVVMVLFLSSANQPNLASCTVQVLGAPANLEVIVSIYNQETEAYEEYRRGTIDSTGKITFTQLVIGQKYKFETAPCDGYTEACSAGHIIQATNPTIMLAIYPVSDNNSNN